MLVVLAGNPQVRGELMWDQFRFELLDRTLRYNGLAALIATTMGLPAGVVLGRGRGWIARLLWVFLPAALLLPSLSYAYGWSQFVRLIRPTLAPLGITFIPNGYADKFRCIWSLAAWLWALPAGLIGISLRRMSTGVQQQALLDGALWRITLRQLLGPIVASMAIVTILATQEFAIYEPTGISVIATELRMVFDTGAPSSVVNQITAPVPQGSGAASPDQPARAAAAVATALPLVVVTLILAVVASWLIRRDAAADTVAVDDWPKILQPTRWTVAVTLVLIAINIGVPVTALICSLRVRFSLPRVYEEFAPQALGALEVGASAGTLAVVLAFSCAGRWSRGLLVVAGATFLIGGQLLAIGLIRIYNRPVLFWAYDAWPLPMMAYIGRFGWLAVMAGRSAWSPPWRDLRDSAQVDGANTLQTALHIIWPLAWPTLLAGGLIVAALSLTEVPATVLLFPQHPQVLTPMLMTWLHMDRYDSMIEASLLMMLTVIAPAVAAVILVGIGLKFARLKAVR